jgi:hypothetical protein
MFSRDQREKYRGFSAIPLLLEVHKEQQPSLASILEASSMTRRNMLNVDAIHLGLNTEITIS